MSSTWLRISSGYRVAFQRWGSGNPVKVLCLHGWLDNSNSFSFLGPHLAEKCGFEVVAVDFVGHGQSDHFHEVCSPSVYTGHVKGIMDSLGWEKSHIVGHSMGANTALLFSGAFPERVDRLALIEGFGPPTEKAESACKQMRKSVLAADAFVAKKAARARRLYPTIQSAIDARVSVVKTYPGTQSLSPQAAGQLIARGARLEADSKNDISYGKHLDLTDLLAGPVYFTYDQKLILPSSLYYTEDQVISYIQALQGPTLFVSAENGWPLKQVPNRMSHVPSGLLKHIHLPGSHHPHLDPENAPEVADTVTKFLLNHSL